MKMKVWKILLACLIPSVSVAEINFSGFASIVGGKTVSDDGDQFLADYSLVGIYDDDFDYQPESTVGLQATADLTDGLSFTLQLVARGLDNFNAEVDYAYFSYEISSNLELQAGRKRLPLQYFSEFFDVGFAYPWIRPPSDLYTWQVLNYNGLSLTYTNRIGNGSLNTTLYTGREKSEDNKLLSTFFFNEPTTENWKNIAGVNFEFNYNILQLLASYTQFELDRDFTSPTTTSTKPPQRDIQFLAFSANIDTGNFFILTEWNDWSEGESQSFETTNWLASFGYRFGDFTPYLVYSTFEQEEITGSAFEEHNTSSAGVRWNFHPQASFKIQYDIIKDEGTLPLLGDSKAVTFGVDMIF